MDESILVINGFPRAGGNADAILVGPLIPASPNTSCEVTGLMKTVVDRLYFYRHPANSSRIVGKRGIVIITRGVEENIAYQSSLMNEFFRRALQSFRIDIRETVLFPGLMRQEDILSMPEYLQQAFELGR